ncbi:fructosamine-3-kinase isoform X2 [Meriones unguiculatus]|uniref:fructosamine-3-kinase isoform X2 n=1 Tax=Meriones unguiculatus TaxID=10047 RepID=UPI00293EE0FF|nr:fructosamine-3-kinase isoform X2 [Meriones unguiculatus]
MEQLLRAELRTRTLRAFGSSGAGCISEGYAYDTDTGPVFVKVNRRTQSGIKAWGPDGRFAPLQPEAQGEGQGPGEHGCGADSAEPQGVSKFGFSTVTCCGFIPQVNEWQDDWPAFFTQHRLQAQLDLIEKDYADRETRELWSRLQVKIPDLFSGIEIVPALLHGDLWSGNVAEDDQGPIIYDPASFYGHSEFELAIALMFGGFPRSFFTAYHRKIPKAPGFDKRLLLYQLFNYLNHWNHFGREYRSPSLGMMRKLLR